MRLRGLIPACLALLVAAALPGGADALWDKAVTFARGSSGWVPSSVSVLLQLLDGKGLVQESWQSWLKLSASDDGSTSLQVVRSVHNGEDTTEREQQSQRRTGQSPMTRWDNPLDPAVQGTVTAQARSQGEVVDDKRCVVYDFTMAKPDKTTLTGTAWLDESTGAPVRIRYSPGRLPRGVAALTTTLRFSRDSGRQGFLQEALIEGAAGILFVQRAFRSVITIDDWSRGGSS